MKGIHFHPREVDILTRLYAGAVMKEIAGDLGVSYTYVKMRMHRLYGREGLTGIVHAMAAFIEWRRRREVS